MQLILLTGFKDQLCQGQEATGISLNPLLAVLFQRNLASKKKKKKKIGPSRDSNMGLSIVSSMPCQPGHYSILK